MTFQEHLKALPEEERVKFHLSLMEVADEGYKEGVPADEL